MWRAELEGPGLWHSGLDRRGGCGDPGSVVGIGGALAEARQRAGLTVADVSARTRIRESLILAIERDEFDGCGGDFYARGHIRAIAAVVGADPYQLIGEYDAAHPAGGPVTLEKLPERPHRAPRGRAPRGAGRPRWLAPVGYAVCLAAIGFVAIRLTPGAADPPSAVVSPARAVASAGARASAASAVPRPSSRPAPASRPASPRPAPKTPGVTEVTPVSATAIGPGGTRDGDNPRDAPLALSGDPATPWRTDWYSTPSFGNMQTGTGLLLGLARSVTAADVTIRLGNTPGADLELRAGTKRSDLPVVADATDAGGTVRLSLAAHPRIRYLLIWFTALPPDSAGTYQADVSSVTVSGF